MPGGGKRGPAPGPLRPGTTRPVRDVYTDGVDEIGIRQARAELAGLVARVATEDTGIILTRHGQPAAALLPAAAAEVWERHQANQAEASAAALAELGNRLPARTTPVCPHCHSRGVR